MLYLLRHAKAGERLDDTGADRDRPLSKKGLEQAQAIAQYLSNKEVVTILSSPFQRCIETVQPLSILSEVEIIKDPVLGEDASIEGLRGIISRYVSKTTSEIARSSIVICTHGNVVPAIIEIIGLYSNDTIRCAKGSLYEIDLSTRKISYLEF